VADLKAGTKVRLLVTFGETLALGTPYTQATFHAGAIGKIITKIEARDANPQGPNIHLRRWFSDPYYLAFDSPLVVDENGRPVRAGTVRVDSSEFEVIG
jgi:hypothetical protein